LAGLDKGANNGTNQRENKDKDKDDEDEDEDEEYGLHVPQLPALLTPFPVSPHRPRAHQRQTQLLALN